VPEEEEEEAWCVICCCYPHPCDIVGTNLPDGHYYYYYLGKRRRNKTKQSKEWSVPPWYGTTVCFEYGSRGLGALGIGQESKMVINSLTTWNVLKMENVGWLFVCLLASP
jgi:hypothetical protein